jgi:hypothetical protein
MSAPPEKGRIAALTGAARMRADATMRAHEQAARMTARVNIDHDVRVDLRLVAVSTLTAETAKLYVYVPGAPAPPIPWPGGGPRLDGCMTAWAGAGQMLHFKPDVNLLVPGIVELTYDGVCPKTRATAHFAHDAAAGTLTLNCLMIGWKD